jgi:hypothetical protein
MAHKRQYGSGQLKEARNGWVIRWWEPEIARDGSKQKMLRYERLGAMCRKQAAEILAQRIAAAGNGKAIRSRVVFRRLVAEWETQRANFNDPTFRHGGLGLPKIGQCAR